MKYFRKAVGVLRTSDNGFSARLGSGAFIPSAFREMGILSLPMPKGRGFYRRCTSLHLFGKESGCRPRELEADQL